MSDMMVDSDNAWRKLGVYMQPRIQAPEWQPMERQIAEVVANQASSIPWLPKGWLDEVNALSAKYPEQRVMLAPALGAGGKRLENTPAFLDSTEKEQAWQTAYEAMRSGISTFANGMRESGLVEMERLNNKAWWADKIYLTVKAIADAPSVVVGAAGDFASGLVGTFLKRFWFVLVIGAVGAVFWFGRKEIGAAASKRVAKAIGG